MSLKPKDEIIINALGERFRELSLSAAPKTVPTTKVPTKRRDTLSSVQQEIIEAVRRLAALPPPSPLQKDNIGFAPSTDAPMRNFLYLYNEGNPITISDWYRAVTMMRLHRHTQIDEGRWQAWDSLLKPIAEAEAYLTGDNLKNTYIYRGHKNKGQTKEGKIKYEYTDKNTLLISINSTTLTQDIYETLLSAGYMVVLATAYTIEVPYGLIKPVLDFLESAVLSVGSRQTNKLPSTVIKGIEELRTKLPTWTQTTSQRGSDITLSKPTKSTKKSYEFVKEFTTALYNTVSSSAVQNNYEVINGLIIAYGIIGETEQVLEILKIGSPTRKIWNKSSSMPHFLYWPFPKTQRSEAMVYLTDNRAKFPANSWDGSQRRGGVLMDQIDSFVKSVQDIPDTEKWKPSLLFVLKTLQRTNNKLWKIPQKEDLQKEDPLSLLTSEPISIFNRKGDSYVRLEMKEDPSRKLWALAKRKRQIQGYELIINQNINGIWYKSFLIKGIPQLIQLLDGDTEQYKEALNALHKKASFKDFMSPKKTPQKTEPSSASKIVTLSEQDRSKALDLLLDYQRNYPATVLKDIKAGNVPAQQLKLILEINKAISALPSDQEISGITFLPDGFSKEYEKRNYNNLGKATQMTGAKQLVFHVPYKQGGKWYLFEWTNPKGKPAARITTRWIYGNHLWFKGTGYEKPYRWMGSRLGNETQLSGGTYSSKDTPSKFLTERARHFDREGGYAFAYGVRSVLLRRKPVLEGCEELQALWGKGEFSDVTDMELLKKIKAMVPKKFEADGIIPSKKMGGKPQKVKFKPYEYQQIGAAFAWLAGGRAYIGDIMGLGKTIQALLFLAIGEEQGKNVYPALIVCPAGLVDNWIKEIKAWLPKKTVSKLLDWEDTNLRVTSFDGMKNNENRIRDIEFRTLIVDEAHYGKNAKSQRSKSMRKIATIKDDKENYITPYVLLLSGTPMENRVDELWTQLYTIAPDAFPTKKAFNDAYSPKNVRIIKGIRIEFEDKEAVKSHDLRNRLAKELRCVMIRRLKSDVQNTLHLPTKERIMVTADIGQEGRNLYMAMERNLLKVVAKALKDRFARQIAQKIKGGIDPKVAKEELQNYLENSEQANLLKKIESTMLAVYGYMRRATGEAKIPAASQWVTNWFRNEKKPLLIWVDHQKVLRSMEKALDTLKIKYGVIDGSVGSKERSELVDKFQSGKLDVMILTKAGREGLTLTRASDALFVERWLVPTWEEQAEDRIYRIGQTEDVKIYYLQFQDSFDDKIEEMIRSKREIIESVVGEEKTGSGRGDIAIQDSIIKEIAKDLTERIRSELKKAPLTTAELMPSDDSIKKVLREKGAFREFLQIVPKPTLMIDMVYKSTVPSKNAHKRKLIWDMIPTKGIPYMTLISKKDVSGSLVHSLKSAGEIKVKKEQHSMPIAKIKLPKSIKSVVTEALQFPNNRMPMHLARELTGTSNIDKMIKDGLAVLVKQEIEL